MKDIKTTLTTEAIFSDDGNKRYLIKKVWDSKKPHLAIIMLAPSEASGIELDTTTMLVLNNCSRLGYGSVSILNLFATLDDFNLIHAESEDTENMDMIIKTAEKSDIVIYAPGVGKIKHKAFQKRQKQVLEALTKYESKLSCLCDKDGKCRLQHPLSPSVRTWYLSQFKINEILDDKKTVKKETKHKEK